MHDIVRARAHSSGRLMTNWSIRILRVTRVCGYGEDYIRLRREEAANVCARCVPTILRDIIGVVQSMHV